MTLFKHFMPQEELYNKIREHIIYTYLKQIDQLTVIDSRMLDEQMDKGVLGKTDLFHQMKPQQKNITFLYRFYFKFYTRYNKS